MKLPNQCFSSMADELTKIALSMGLDKRAGSPNQLLFSASRIGRNTPVRMAANPPIPPIGGPKMPTIAQTNPGGMMQANASIPRTPNIPAMQPMKS